MYELNKNKNIPCYYHVPKTAGTYIFSKMVQYLRILNVENSKKYNWPKICTLRIDIVDGGQLATIFLADPNNVIKEKLNYDLGQNAFPITINLIQYYAMPFDELDIISLIIQPAGFKIHDFIKNPLKEYNLINFMTLREPISTSISFFNYLNSDESAHEITHRSIPSDFEEYVNICLTGDSWIIRQLGNVNKNTVLAQKHLEEVYVKIKDFNFEKIENTEDFIESIYFEYLGLSMSDEWRTKFKRWNVKDNKASTKPNLPITKQLIQKMNQKLKYDIMLYNRLCSLINKN